MTKWDRSRGGKYVFTPLMLIYGASARTARVFLPFAPPKKREIWAD